MGEQDSVASMSNAQVLLDKIQEFILCPTLELQEKIAEHMNRYQESFNATHTLHERLEGYRWTVEGGRLRFLKPDGSVAAVVYPPQQDSCLIGIAGSNTLLYARNEALAMVAVEKHLCGD